MEKVGKNHWQAHTLSGKKHEDGEFKGQEIVYHLDDNGAKQVLNYLA